MKQGHYSMCTVLHITTVSATMTGSILRLIKSSCYFNVTQRKQYKLLELNFHVVFTWKNSRLCPSLVLFIFGKLNIVIRSLSKKYDLMYPTTAMAITTNNTKDASLYANLKSQKCLFVSLAVILQNLIHNSAMLNILPVQCDILNWEVISSKNTLVTYNFLIF